MDFIRVSSACPLTDIGNLEFNLKNIEECIDKAMAEKSKLIVFPELSITSYTCADLFEQQLLLEKIPEALKKLCEYSRGKDILIAVGAPVVHDDCLYNCACIVFKGSILGIVPKSYIPNYEEFYEKRWFTEGTGVVDENIDFCFQKDIPFGVNLIFTCENFKFGFEICEDLWAVIPPSSYLCLMGANIIGNLSASNEIVSKSSYRRNLIRSQSARGMCSYVYSSSGVFESSTDLVFSGDLCISENGIMLNSNERFKRENEVITSILDVDKLKNQRLKNVSFRDNVKGFSHRPVNVEFQFESTDYGKFDRKVDRHPFVPDNEGECEIRCREIFNIQTAGLGKRISHTNLKKAVVGISGGLDSTLALLVVVKTFDILKIPRKNIITITMPGFGTTDRTYNNAVSLCKNLNTEFREINIVKACIQHFKDISHDENIHDVTYENVQARERTQIMMDIANKEGGLVIGTGDLSELALGWCTYNGDHMSMYGVNCSIPKTLVRYLVKYVADREASQSVSRILIDVLDTPVSPELLPKDKEGKISQKTEDIVGPYELHDFFLYYFVRLNYSPQKILFLAKQAYEGCYSSQIIEKWLNVFIKRFFTQQFKRSAIPDGPKVGTVSLSPRGDWRMPSDASYKLWARSASEN
ncbi:MULTISPECIES: NAD(+) synthase [Clostridium]|jgi:NAD+ synthase (glutamine-hydrolysing)|uniref:Glutamine-dependent NAD(+) synthetase n=1 Tax=Clostridium lapidicellarium TaxID=3240931 RepID=A0ABV4DYY2_9CLOT|nr:NAD(+) synthase [uncultured Clostridium sp.]NLU07315.1 NAD(+) synthase [Clostridiales bacterium]